MATDADTQTLRCSRCGREAQAEDKFCAECGMFLRDASKIVEHRYGILALQVVFERDGRRTTGRTRGKNICRAHTSQRWGTAIDREGNRISRRSSDGQWGDQGKG